MSAYICPGRLTTYLARAGELGSYWWSASPLRGHPPGGPAEIAQMLREENYASVLHRYNAETADEMIEEAGPAYIVYDNIRDLPEMSPANVFSALDTYEYQSCEHRGWLDSDAREFCSRLRNLWCQVVQNEDPNSASWADWA